LDVFDRAQQELARRDDREIAGRQVLLGAILSRPRPLDGPQVLHLKVVAEAAVARGLHRRAVLSVAVGLVRERPVVRRRLRAGAADLPDRKSTRLNSSHALLARM